MNEDRKVNGLKPVITSTPCGKRIGSMWEMLNTVISPIGNLPDHATNEKKLLPRQVQRYSARKPSSQHTGKNVLSTTIHLAEYRSMKHTSTQSQFPRLEVIESDDDDDEVIPQTANAIDKNVIRSLKKKKISELHTLNNNEGRLKHKIVETVGELTRKEGEVDNKKSENDPPEEKCVKKTERNNLKPKRFSVKEQKKEGTKIKKSESSNVRCKPYNKKINLRPTKHTIQNESEPSIVVIDASETGCKHKRELNSLISNNGSVSKSSQLSHQKDDLCVPESGQYSLRNRKPKVNSLISNGESSISESSQLIHQNDELSIQIIETRESGQRNLYKSKHEINSSRSTKSSVPKSDEETCVNDESNELQRDELSIQIIEARESGQRNLYKCKHELNSSRSTKSSVPKSDEETCVNDESIELQREVSESSDEKKDTALLKHETCKKKYNTRKKMKASCESDKIPHKEECFSTFEEAVFHKNEGVSIAICVNVANFTAGYVEIDRQKIFSSKITNLIFHVLEGEPEVTVNKITKCVKPGTFIYIPPGSHYQIKNSFSERVRLSYTKVVT